MRGDDSQFFSHLSFLSFHTHYRPIRDQLGLPEGNGTIFSDRTGKLRRMALTIFYSFPETFTREIYWTGLPKWIKRQISVWPVRVFKVDHLQSSPKYSVRWNSNGPFHLIPTEIFRNFGIVEGVSAYRNSSCYTSTSRWFQIVSNGKCLRACVCWHAVAWNTRLKPDWL